MPAATVFEASDLNENGRAVLQAARAGEAQVRAEDGVSFRVMTESRARALECRARAAVSLATLQQTLATPSSPPFTTNYGEWPWLENFDDEDLQEFIHEILELLTAPTDEASEMRLEEMLQAWRLTAEELADPVRREILLGTHSGDDFVEAVPPPACE